MSASAKGYFEVLDPNALYEGAPCDSGEAWTTLDNILHLVDVTPSYRVNWVDAGSDLHGIGLLRGNVVWLDNTHWVADLRLSVSFPTCMLRDGQYPSYDVRLNCKTNGPVGTFVYASVILATPPAAAFSSLSDPHVLGILSGSTSSTTASWVIDDVIEPREVPAVPGTVLTHRDLLSDTHIPAWVSFVRADIQLYQVVEGDIEGPAPETAQLLGLQIREYPSA